MRSSLVAVARKSREMNLTQLLRVKASPLANVDGLAIGVENVSLHASGPYLACQLSWFRKPRNNKICVRRES
jgi:hypothetical protein